MPVPHYPCSNCGRCICECDCPVYPRRHGADTGRYTCPVCGWTLAYTEADDKLWREAGRIVGEHRLAHQADGVGVTGIEGLTGRAGRQIMGEGVVDEQFWQALRDHLVTTRLD